MSEKQLLWVLVVLLVVSTVVDMFTAFSSPIFALSESNPLFLLFKGPIIMSIISVFLTGYIAFALFKVLSFKTIFLCTLTVFFVCAGHFFGAYSNMVSNEGFVDGYGYVEEIPDNIPLEEQQQIITNNEVAIENFKQDTVVVLSPYNRLIGYLKIVSLLFLLPFILSYTSFCVAYKFYEARRPKREKLIKDICSLANQVENG